jgi:hypothetical protein
MKKIPVGRTIADAYSFTFGQIGVVIGLIWLPLVVFTLSRFFVVDYYTAQLVGSGDPSATGRAILITFAFSLISLLFTAVIGVSLTRQAMSPRSGTIILHFALGPMEFNYFLSLLAIFVVMFAVYIALVFADFILAAAADALIQAVSGAVAQAGKIATVAALGLIFALDLAAIVFIGVRLAAFVAPVTVAEGKIDLIRSWQMSNGNFWRLFLVLLVTLGPILIVSELGFAAIVGPAYLVKFAQAMLALFQAVAGNGQVPTQTLAQLPDISQKAPLILGLNFLLAPFTYGLLFAAPAFAYRALNGSTPVLPTPDTGPFRPA